MAAAGLEVLAPPWVQIAWRTRWGARRALTLAPVTLGALPGFLAAVGPALAAHRADPEADLSAYDSELLDALALVADADRQTIARMPPVARVAAVRALIELHPELFTRPEASSKGAPASDPAPWPDVIAALLAAGHRWHDIQGYTLSQVRAHLEASARRESVAQARAIIAARMAWGEGRAVQREVARLMRAGGATP